jgi:hypothetical protein
MEHPLRPQVLALDMFALARKFRDGLCIGTDGATVFGPIRGSAVARGTCAFRSGIHIRLLLLEFSLPSGRHLSAEKLANRVEESLRASTDQICTGIAAFDGVLCLLTSFTYSNNGSRVGHYCSPVSPDRKKQLSDE